MTWAPHNHQDYDQFKGYDVYGSKNNKIGTVDQVLHPAHEQPNSRDHYLLVDAGPLGGLIDTKQLYVPETDIEMVGDDRLVLDVSKDQIQDRGWDSPPEGYGMMV